MNTGVSHIVHSNRVLFVYWCVFQIATNSKATFYLELHSQCFEGQYYCVMCVCLCMCMCMCLCDVCVCMCVCGCA